MAKKYYANMPKEVKRTVYPSLRSAMTESGYVDTQPQLDKEFKKAASKLRRA